MGRLCLEPRMSAVALAQRNLLLPDLRICTNCTMQCACRMCVRTENWGAFCLLHATIVLGQCQPCPVQPKQPVFIWQTNEMQTTPALNPEQRMTTNYKTHALEGSTATDPALCWHAARLQSPPGAPAPSSAATQEAPATSASTSITRTQFAHTCSAPAAQAQPSSHAPSMSLITSQAWSRQRVNRPPACCPRAGQTLHRHA